jgi:cell wall-associated NlpC family hydrolase
MAFRFKGGYSVPGKGTVSARKKTFVGKGPAPVGTKKVKTPVPRIVTTSASGKVSTSGFPTASSASRAKQQTRAARARARRIEARQASALGFHRRSQQRASERLPRPSAAASAKRDAPISAKTVVSSRPLGGGAARGSRPDVRPPSYKPPKFQGAKTAGTPSLKELQVAASSGKLRTNRKGYVTTPAVRKTAGTLKRLESKARRSNGPLPGLTPSQSKNARTVLRRGVKADATRKELLAAAETGLVEAPNFENPAGGDADSEGWRQERTSIYGTGPTGPRNVKASADRFYKELRTDPGAASAATAGMAAQAAQGSAFPERYDEVKPQANAIVKAFERGGLRHKQQAKLGATRQRAQRLGLRVGRSQAYGPAPKRVVTRFKAIKAAAGALTKRHIPYVWGGGHGSVESAPTGLDCSGAVSWVLNKAGILKTPLTSGSMGEVLKPGPGAVTVFYNPTHTFMKIGNEYWGTSVGDSGAGGLGPHPAPSASYLAQYSVGHVPGLGKKQALQLGFSPAASESFPGMTLSASGTTATVDPSATATRDKPGFSKSPIKLTPNQKAHRTLKKLAQLGAGVSQPPSGGTEDKGAILAELERKYGKAAV